MDYNSLGQETRRLVYGKVCGQFGTITLDGKLNSTNGTMIANHATVDGLTAQQAEDLFTPTQKNPVPKELRGW